MRQQQLQLARYEFTNVKFWSPQAAAAARDKKSELRLHARSPTPCLRVLPERWQKSSRKLAKGVIFAGAVWRWNAWHATRLTAIGSDRS